MGENIRLKCQQCLKTITEHEATNILPQLLGPEWRDVILTKEGAYNTRKRKTNDEEKQKSNDEGMRDASNCEVETSEQTNVLQLVRKLIFEQKVSNSRIARMQEQYNHIQSELFRAKRKITQLENENCIARDSKEVPSRPNNPNSEVRNKVINTHSPVHQNSSEREDRAMNAKEGGKTTISEPNKRPTQNWAQVVMSGTKLQSLPTNIKTKKLSMKQPLISSNCINTQVPKVTAVYFKNIQRCKIGQLRVALRESLPSLATLRLSFIGESRLELLCDVTH